MPQYLVGVCRLCASGSHRESVAGVIFDSFVAKATCPAIADILHIPAKPPHVHCVPTPVARNKVARYCKERNVDFLVSVDDDLEQYPLGFIKAAVEHLISLRDKGECGIVAAPYVCGPPNEEVMVFEWMNTPAGVPSLINVVREDAARRTGIEEVANIGTHLICWDMRAFEIVPPPWFDYLYNREHTTVLETEDTHFHRKCFAAGVKIFCAWDYWAGHYKGKAHGKPRVPTHDEARAFLHDFWGAPAAKPAPAGVSPGTPETKNSVQQSESFTEESIPGWFDFADVYQEAVDGARDGSAFVEVGCWKGKSMVALARMVQASGKRITLHAVDHFLGSPGEDVMDVDVHRAGGSMLGVFRENLKQAGVRDLVHIHPMESVVCAETQPDAAFDFVFLDGDHGEAAVLADLRAWWPKVKPGGRIGGHDYGDPLWPGVVAAVETFAEGLSAANAFRQQGRCFLFTKAAAEANGDTHAGTVGVRQGG